MYMGMCVNFTLDMFLYPCISKVVRLIMITITVSSCLQANSTNCTAVHHTYV